MCQFDSSGIHGEHGGNHHTDHATLYMPLVDHKTGSNDEPPVINPLSPTKQLSLTLIEAKSILSIALPMVLTGLLLYSRSLISMLFLGRLGSLPLAGGSLAIGFANITGYSVLSGLATGMEPICGQAHGAGRNHLLGLALRRTILLLLSASLPISLLWFFMRHILILCGQHPDIADAAQTFILFSLPDLFLQSFLHPLRVYFRTQSITLPLTATAAATVALHFPINHLLINHFHLGVPGVALASVFTNLNLVLLLIAYLHFSGLHLRTGGLIPSDGDDTFSLSGWRSLIALAVPSCISVCLEWWWYEIMVLLCGLLLRPQSTVASMGLLIQTTSLIYIFPSSLSAGVSTRVSNELGANRPDRARRAATVGLICGSLLGLTALSFSLSVRNVWAKIFTSDPEIVSLTSAVLPILGLCELGNCPQTTGCGVLRGSARPRAGANINLGSFYGVGMPVAIGLAFWARLDFRGLWFGLLSAQAACLVLMLAVIASTDWTRQADRAQCLTGEHNVVAHDCKPIIIKIEQCDSLLF
ncbi:protein DETOXIFICATION 49 [Dendrobium catenatum]|uniref:Protein DETOXIFICATION n=1 Tax=Dendrobium catenatum TaxID=906689 RepID=A0A2I0XE94_9ASPA|nr:protein DETOXIFICATION 49 [Dendrobium catenatum]PKU86219.1 MATE efflux family protein 9 [Dendrobium catenatum]